MNISDDILHLITLHLSQKGSGVADSKLQEWLDASPENQKEFDKIARVWESSGQVFANPVDVEGEWDKFRSKHFVQAESEPKVRRLVSNRAISFMAMAAALILGIFIGLRYLNSSDLYSTSTGERLLVSLEDGTEVILSQNSTLKVSSDYNGSDRKVELEGEAFFTVAKDASRPFEIKGTETTTRVLGTAFQLISTRGESYVQVSEGKVAFWENDNKDTLILTRGERGSLEGEVLQETLLDGNFDSWKSGVFEFDNHQIVEVLVELQDHYLFDISNLGEFSELNCRFSGKFKDQTLESVLEEFALIMGMEYELKDGQMRILDVNCP